MVILIRLSRKTWGRFLNEAYLRRTYLQGQLHVLAGKVARTSVENAVHSKDGCSTLRRRLQCTASEMGKLATESSALFGIRDKGGETHPIRVSVAPLIYLVIQNHLLIQSSGFSLAVSLRNWKWSTQLPSLSFFTVPRMSRACTFCPLATMTEERLQ